MAPYAIADIRDVLEQGKVVCRELLPNQGKALLWMYIYWAEKALEQYLAHSSQKTFMGPELSTIKMREKLADEGMQRLLSVEATSDESEPTKHDLAIVSDERGPFEYHLRLWHDVQDALLGIHSFTHTEIQNVHAYGYRLPPIIVITSFGTYHVCSRHHVTRQNSFDERLVLEDHHQALSAQTKLLTGQRNAVDVMSPPDGGINLSASTWRKETDGLMRKLSGWEKELVWGKAAVALGERSCVAVFPPYGDEDDDEEHDGGDDGGMDGGDEGGLDGGDDGGMDESSGLGPAQG